MAPKRVQSKFDDEIFLLGDVYYYRGTPEGQKVQKEVSLRIRKGAAQKDVLKAKKLFLDGVEISSGTGAPNSFNSVSKHYVAFRSKEHQKNPLKFSEHSLYETKSMIDLHLEPYFGKMRIENITQPVFADYCQIKFDEGHNLTNHRKVLSHLLKWSVQYGYIKYRAEINIPGHCRKARRQRVVLSDDQVTRLLTAASGNTLLYVMMYLFMGMRNKEICKLRWDEVDLEKQALQINPLNNRRRKARVIPINPFILKLLKARYADSTSDWVLPSTHGKTGHLHPKGAYRKGWYKALASAGITEHITPHDLRATFEKHMHMNSTFTDTQREKMAGASIDVQKNIYVSMDADDLRGLEKSVQMKGLTKLLQTKIRETTREKKPKKGAV